MTVPMFLGVLGFPPLLALLLFMTVMTQPSGIKRAGTAGPGPQGGKVGTPRQSSGGAPAAPRRPELFPSVAKAVTLAFWDR